MEKRINFMMKKINNILIIIFKEIPNLILNIILYCFLKIVNNQLIFKLC